jgi:predicted RNase H-like HicB family nuclease
MTYHVVLIETEEGIAVGCPALPGCWSQGATQAEALENIREAIREVLDAKWSLESERWEAEGARIETAEVEIPTHA